MTAEQWSLPGLFVQTHLHAPDIVFARHDFAFDQTQQFFGALAGFPADQLVDLIDQNEAQIEASGAELFSYISPGDSHTILGSPGFYTQVVNDVALVQWVTDLVNGEPIADVPLHRVHQRRLSTRTARHGTRRGGGEFTRGAAGLRDTPPGGIRRHHHAGGRRDRDAVRPATAVEEGARRRVGPGTHPVAQARRLRVPRRSRCAWA